ncbi:MAG: LD-carboxypeptidase [Clostridia bacterium]|nr:LD-carboxypeptidase [Clostridia bacterium]
MRYPEKLKIGDTIGICAPSAGITEPEKVEKLNQAIQSLEKMGYKVIETESVRKDEKGRSTTASKRAEEFMELWKNEEVKLILYAGGGDFLMEMLDELDFKELKKLPPKWTQGFSDITTISFLLNTICDIPSMYCDAIKDYAMTPLYRNLSDSLKLISGEDIIQESFEKHIDGEEYNTDYTYNLTLDTKWRNITGQKEIFMQGRAIGGCLDCVDTLIGTKFDTVKEYIEKYKQDGILWFLECYETNTPQLERTLWKMKNAGYFEHCKGIIFGRPYILREDYEIDEDEAILDVIRKIKHPNYNRSRYRAYTTTTCHHARSNFKNYIKKRKRNRRNI